MGWIGLGVGKILKKEFVFIKEYELNNFEKT